MQRRLPGGREHPGVAGARQGRRARAGVARADRGQPVPRDPRPGLLPPVRERLQPRASSTAPSRSTRSSGSSAIWRSSAAGGSTRRRRRSGKRVLVIGAGPSGLSAAYHLARLGHEVEIRDAGPEPGGMMRYGIPAYRLPRDVLAREVARIAALGVRITQRPPGRGPRGRAPRGRLRRGVRGGRRAPVKAGRHPGRATPGAIVDAVSFLRGVASGERPVIGRRVAVYGGGNTAMDAARVARRLGAEEALIVYRRTREQMPAHEEEAADAEREGVRINWLRTIKAFDGPELKVEVMELDETGYPQPTGRFETLAADTVILALGQETDTALPAAVPGVEFDRDGTVRVSTSLMTGCPGVFAGGDMVPARAHGHGRRRARQAGRAAHRRVAAGLGATSRRRSIRRREFDLLHLWYFGDAARRQQPELAPRGARRRLRRGGRRSDRRRRRCSRRAGACRAATASSATAASAPAPRSGDQARPGAALPVRLRPLHRLRGVLRAVPGALDRDGRRSTRVMRATRRRQRGGGVGRLPAATRSAASTRSRPSSPMAELADEWSSQGPAELWGTRARPWWRCRARAARRARCTARCRAARWRRRSPRRRACC